MQHSIKHVLFLFLYIYTYMHTRTHSHANTGMLTRWEGLHMYRSWRRWTSNIWIFRLYSFPVHFWCDGVSVYSREDSKLNLFEILGNPVKYCLKVTGTQWRVDWILAFAIILSLISSARGIYAPHMYMYIYVYMHIYVYVCIHTHLHICMYICIYTYMYMHTYVYIFLHKYILI